MSHGIPYHIQYASAQRPSLGVNKGMGDKNGQKCWRAVPGRLHGEWALFRVGVIWGFYDILCQKSKRARLAYNMELTV